jgi:tetratricopeptide (TPR) repeat protein
VKLHALVLAASAAFPAPHVHSKTPEQIFDDASRSMVVIHGYTTDGKPTNQGSGVSIGRESVVTNCHVLEDAAKLNVLYQYQTYDATVRATDVDRDLCELKVPRLPAAPATFFPGRLRVGQRVYAIGAPEGLELTISEGLVSSIRDFEGAQYIQTSAPISAGSSGGGLFDVEGRLVGITAFIVPEGQNINFALPVGWVAELAMKGGAPVQLTLAREVQQEKWASRAAELKGKGDWVALLAYTQQWVRAAPLSVPAWEALGGAYLKINRPRRALTAYERAVRLDGDAYDAWVNLGSAHLMLNQYDRALDAYAEALRLKSGDLSALAGTGAVYFFQNRPEKVREVHAQIARADAAAARDFARKYLVR